MRATVLAMALLLAALGPHAGAAPLVPSQCAEQDLGVATLSACTPAVDGCISLALPEGGFVTLCVKDLAGSPDNDGDGFSVKEGDCDDGDPSVHPGAPETLNGIDDDCDGEVDEGIDLDGDTYSLPMDCNDNDSSASPEGVETLDRRDNDCDGQADEGSQDGMDLDGDGVALDAGDCDDNDGASAPGAPEIADRKDNDCNGLAEA